MESSRVQYWSGFNCRVKQQCDVEHLTVFLCYYQDGRIKAARVAIVSLVHDCVEYTNEMALRLSTQAYFLICVP